PWTHRGYDLDRIVGHMYMTLEGIFGTAVDVSATLIILFTIYGAFLQYSGAGKFFLDFSFASMGGKPSSAGRAVVLASFLLGGPSGSGVATTVTIGSVAWPLLQKSGYGKEAAGGLLAAGGMGAILSPPVLGAAAFLIAEFLKISYLDVILMATIPTILYYFGIFLMVQIDASKFGMPNVVMTGQPRLGELTRRYGFHFLSLVSIVIFMLLGYSPILSVFWAILVAFAVSFFQRDCALISYDVFRGRMPVLSGLWNSGLVKALENGSLGMLNVGATCAAAGIIVGVVTLTGLGLKFSAIVLNYADGGVAVRGRGDHRRRSLPDDDASLEIHDAGVPRAVHVRAGSFRARAAARRLVQEPRECRLAGSRRSEHHRDDRHRGACRRHAELAVQEDHGARAVRADRRGSAARLSEDGVRHRRHRAGAGGRRLAKLRKSVE